MKPSTIFGIDAFQSQFDVSRETISKLSQYERQLTKWNQRINLISPSTMPEIWHRHFADSAQLLKQIPVTAKKMLDIGSGAGFPALVLAIIAQESLPDLKFTLVESDQRKCAFLLNISHLLALSVDIQSQRVEDFENQKFDVISARALASLSDLLEMTEPFCNKTTICLFPKGMRYESELTEARKIWHIKEQQIPSLTDNSAVILRIESFSRA